MNYLIICDPSGAYSARFIERGVSPDDIYVYEDTHKGTVCSESRGVHVISDLSEVNDMKFDVIIGNPPYQDSNNRAKNVKLWHKFSSEALSMLKDGGTLSFITPFTVLAPTGFGARMVKLLSTDYDLSLIDYNVTDQFDVGVSICRWVVHRRPYGGTTTVRDGDVTYQHDLRTGMPMDAEQRLIHSILEKVAHSPHDRMPLIVGQPIANVDYSDDGRYEVYSSGDKVRRTDVTPTTGDALKLIVPFSSSYKSRFVSSGYVGMLNAYCEVDSEEQAQHLSDHFDNPVVRFFVDRYKRIVRRQVTSGFAVAIKYGSVPLLDTFDDIQQQFGLTDDEYKYVLQNA